MNVTKTIKLKIVKRNNDIICDDLSTLCLILGTKSVSGNLSIYKVVKNINKKYIVPILFIKDRIKVLENRRNKLNDSLDIMRQVVK